VVFDSYATSALGRASPSANASPDAQNSSRYELSGGQDVRSVEVAHGGETN